MSASPSESFVALVKEILLDVGPAAGHPVAEINRFFRAHQEALLSMIEQRFGAGLRKGVAAEDWDPRGRAEANLAAMRLLAQRGETPLSAADRLVVGRYSGWGGVGLARYAERFPEGFPVPEARGLVHEYYTPSKVWRGIAEMLRRQRFVLPAGSDGLINTLEPSAGIGRALAAFADWPSLRWTALEASAVSARMVRALYPEARVVEGFAERWFATTRDRYGLVLANPPYGPRGESLELDPDGYKTKQAYLYFVMRCADRLAASGIGVFIIPTGLMTSTRPDFVRHRQELLRRAHLLAAWRLPSVPPPGGSVADVAYDQFVVDVVLVQGRGGKVVGALPASDGYVVDGQYFARHPEMVLGTPLGNVDEATDQPAGPKVRRGFQLQGRFTGFPDFRPRPMVEVEVEQTTGKPSRYRGGLVRAEASAVAEDAPTRIKQAVALGERVDRYLAAVAGGQSSDDAGQAELLADLATWAREHGDPRRDPIVRDLAEANNVAALRFVTALPGGRPMPELQAAHARAEAVRPASLSAVAELEYRRRGGLPLTLQELAAAAQRVELAGTVSVARVMRELWPIGWRLDGESIEPVDAFATGLLWDKIDRSERLRADWPVQAEAQVRELRAAIGWLGGAELVNASAPNQPWIPLGMLEAFADQVAEFSWIRGLKREDGLLMPLNAAYESLTATEDGLKRGPFGVTRLSLNFLGWVNQDKQLWRPANRKERDANGQEVSVPVERLRAEQEAAWLKAWQEWVRSDDTRITELEEAYNRTLRGYVPPRYSSEPVPIARWNQAIRLHGYQTEALRKLLANRSGLLSFDVGLGKTYTGIALIARARQEGWARRPVVVVPNTIVWKWFRDFQKAVPDFRVVVIGAHRRQVTTKDKTGRSSTTWVSRPDTPEERGEKWSAFQAGAYDVAVVAYTALGRTQLDAERVAAYVGKTAAIRRSVRLALEAADAQEEAKPGKGGKAPAKRRTERDEADMAERVRAWVGDKLSLPRGWQYDAGIRWDQLGIDLLMVDEGQNFKNLFFSEREGQADAEASKRAWSLDFRCADVRARTGGSGVFVLSATPMKNAAAEFYNLLHLINPALWEQVQVTGPEDFISAFARIEPKLMTQGDGSRKMSNVVVGFRHLDVLRSLVFRWATFKNAEEVGLKLPEVTRIQHPVRATEVQRQQFASLIAELVDVADKMKLLVAKAKGDPSALGALTALRMKKQGLVARLYLASVHPALAENGAPGRAEDGPKLVEVVRVIEETKPQVCFTSPSSDEWCLDCGHLVFAENLRVHDWLIELLVKAGIRRDRIAVLNAVAAADLEKRQQIAEGFNGVGAPGDEDYQQPKYDVVIANSIANEGIDLQRRTCAVHHIDLPWESATLQQRNGRAWRQGNRFTKLSVHFYMVQGSAEAHRLDKIERKRGILTDLWAGGAVAGNTVVADEVDASDEDLASAFAAFAAPEVAARLQAQAADAEAEARHRARMGARVQASSTLRDALVARRRLARASEDTAIALRTELTQLEERLGSFARDIWPEGLASWPDLARAALDQGEALVPPGGPPLCADVLVRLAKVPQQGVSSREGTVLRVVGDQVSMLWEGDSQTHPFVTMWKPFTAPEDYLAAERVAPQWGQRLNDWNNWMPFKGRLSGWNGTLWYALGDGLQDELWPRIVEHNRASVEQTDPYKPVPTVRDGVLRLEGGVWRQLPLIAPTSAGWQQFLDHAARQTQLRHSELHAVAQSWWGRALPSGTVGRALTTTR